MERFAACFAELEDPREDNARHALNEILMIALCAMLCGAEDCSDMALFGRAKEAFLRQFFELHHGRVFRLLDPAQFQLCFLRFMDDFAAAAGPNPTEILVCKNGLLHLPTRHLRPPTPAFFTLNALNYDFDPTRRNRSNGCGFSTRSGPTIGKALPRCKRSSTCCSARIPATTRCFLSSGRRAAVRGQSPLTRT
jgi:hypothetical protein